MFLADAMDGAQFIGRIQCAIFGWMREIDHAGHDHVIAVAVLLKIFEKGINLIRGKLAEFVGQRQDFMAAEFYGASFVNADVSRICRNDTLIGGQHCIDDGGVCLRAADEKMHFTFRRVAGRENFFGCAVRDSIRAIARHRRVVDFHHFFENGRMGAFHIVGSKGQKIMLFIHGKSS